MRDRMADGSRGVIPRGMVLALLLLTGPSLAAAPAAASATPADFIRSLGDQALQVIQSNAGLGQKAAYFRQLLHQDFDLPGICRFVLGPYWRSASPQQRQEFGSVFEAHLLRFYGERLAQYAGGSLRVTGSRSDATGATVTSQILRRQGPPVEVDWQLAVDDGVYRIADVAIAGVSMALTERSTFAAKIARDGGQIDGLIAELRSHAGDFATSAAPQYPSAAGPAGG